MRKILGLAFIAILWANPAIAMSNFDDGTLQGWSKGTPFFNPLFGGNLGVSSFGNPGGSMIAHDTVGRGGGLLAQAPVTFTCIPA